MSASRTTLEYGVPQKNVVTEVDIPTVETDTTFDAFLLRTERQIQQTVEDYRRRFGYIFLIINIIAMMTI